MSDKSYTDVSAGNGITLQTGAAGGGASGTYNVYVVDLLGSGDRTQTVHPSWKDQADPDHGIAATKDAVTATLQDWITKVAAAATPAFTKAQVNWVTSFPSGIQPNELYVYLTGALAADGKTPTAKGTKFGGAATNAINQKKGGMTQLQPGKGVLCEVWPCTIGQGASPNKFVAMLPKLIFHEWMHFKIDIDPGAGDVVHANSSPSLGAIPIDEAADLQTGDVTSVAGGLAKTYKFVT